MAFVAVALWAAAGATAGTAAWAEDFLTTSGRLSDEDFYRLVACRAMPGAGCSQRMVRWPARQAMNLGVGLVLTAEDYPPTLAGEVSAAIDTAIGALNRAGAGVRLFRARTAAETDITIHLVGAAQGETIRGTGHPGMDGVVIEAALVQIRWNLAGQIRRGTIAVASDIPQAEAYPVLLEEITQSLGLMTDIRNPYYRGSSVFSEDSNSVTSLSDQDLYALRRHYPPR